MRRKGHDGKELCCSFCGKSQKEVKKLIAGPSVYICDECVELCNDIITEEYEREDFYATRGLVPKPKASTTTKVVAMGSKAKVAKKKPAKAKRPGRTARTDAAERAGVAVCPKALYDALDVPGVVLEDTRAAEILARKVTPDLKSQELTGKDGGPVAVTLLDFLRGLPE